MGQSVMTLLAVQIANVAGEEARQVLNEIDFQIFFPLFSENHQHQQPKQYSSLNKLALNFTRAYYGSLLNGLLFGALLTEVLKVAQTI